MRLELVIDLPASGDEVWEILTDWERQADWMLDADRVTVVGPQRTGVGVRLVVKTRLAGIPAFAEPMEVIGWEPPERLLIRHGGPVAGTGTWMLDPVPGGTTRFTWREDIQLRVPLVGELAARGYAPIMQWLMGRAQNGLRASIIAAGPGRLRR
jgi:uncharacterized protein YndB with AHSA1/START domain